MGFLKSVSTLLLVSTLVACGSNGGGGSPSPGVTVESPTSTLNADSMGKLTVSGKATSNSTVTITFPDGSKKVTTADSSGNYSSTSSKAQDSGEVFVVVTDTDGNSSTPSEKSFTADLDSIVVLKAIYKETGEMPELAFEPSLGINTEAPQGADTAGMPMPFVDIFRTARPLSDQATSGTEFDQYGWVTKFAPSVNYAQTKLLQGALEGSIPNGKYTVFYKNDNDDSHLEFGSGPATNYEAELVNGLYEGSFDLQLDLFDNEENEAEVSSLNAISLNIRGNNGNGATSSLKDISFIMPGGTCEGNPYLHMSSALDCPSGVEFKSFASRLKTDRNTIIFNPDYLLFLRNFKVLRMMNLMEASHGKAYCSQPDGCPNRVDEWSNRAGMNDAIWGGSDRTDYTKRNGVPVEVIINLANILERDIWVNMPHPANDNYITEFAEYTKENLTTPNSKIYIEYSNEIWNSGFTGHDYVASKGYELNFDDNLPTYNETLCAGLADDKKDANRCGKYFAGLRYYSKRSAEIFTIWKNVYDGDSSKLVNVLGTSQGDVVRTDEMIKYIGATNIDAIAMAPYFYGCATRVGFCQDTESVGKVLSAATTVNDVFDIIDQPYDDSNQSNITGDPAGISGTIAKVKRQLNVINAYDGIDLISYEGGQHLTTSILTHFVTIPAIENAQLASVTTITEAQRTQILEEMNTSIGEISANKDTIINNANSDGSVLAREQDVIDKLNIYETTANTYITNVNNVLADNNINATEAALMKSDYTQLRTERAQVVEAQKGPYRKLFKDANRDSRMKERYITFLNGWKDLSNNGTGLFTLYTLPQSYYRFGNFGIKEHLNMSREDSPKFDGIMTFQEAVETCWWANCSP